MSTPEPIIDKSVLKSTSRFGPALALGGTLGIGGGGGGGNFSKYSFIFLFLVYQGCDIIAPLILVLSNPIHKTPTPSSLELIFLTISDVSILKFSHSTFNNKFPDTHKAVPCSEEPGLHLCLSDVKLSTNEFLKAAVGLFIIISTNEVNFAILY